MGDVAKYVKLVTRERGRLRRLNPPLLADPLGAARSARWRPTSPPVGIGEPGGSPAGRGPARGEGHGCSASAGAPPAARDRRSLVAAADRRGPHPVSRVPAGPPAGRGRPRAGRPPGPRAGHLMSPPSAVRLSIAPTPRCRRRDGGRCPPHVCLVPPEGRVAPTAPVSTPASVPRPPARWAQIPSPGPPAQIQSPEPAGHLSACGLSAVSAQAGTHRQGGSVQPVLPGGPTPGVAGLFCERPAG